MSGLVIAEKPEVGRAIGKAINNKSEEKEGFISGDKWNVTWAFGHLLELVEPESYDEKYLNRKDINILPIYFDNWKRQPAADKKMKSGDLDNSYKRKQLKRIGKLLKDADCVVHAGDPDEEGQLLIDEILDWFGYSGKVYRVLINDNLPSQIRKEFEHLKDNLDYRYMGQSAYARQMADKSFGINHSRLASIRLERPVFIGRVMTPTLALVVNRDNQMASHMKREYYDLTVNIQIGTNSLPFRFIPKKEITEDGKHVFDEVVIRQMEKSIVNKSYDNVSFTRKKEKKYPPLPYELTELQSDMNRRFGYSLKKTLEITQSLRDKYHAITYNRSDCPYLKEEHRVGAPAVLSQAFKNINKTYPVDYDLKSKCFDDSKVQAHHGIIPQNKSVSLSDMSKDEATVYQCIVERYSVQFLPPIIKDVCKAEIQVPSGKLVYSASRIVDEGYLKYFSNSLKNDENLMLEQDVYRGVCDSCSIEEKETKPLPLYTPNTLVKDMQSIAKYVRDSKLKEVLIQKDKEKKGENGSIGTVATRAAIVDKLLALKYLEMKGKSIISTQLGKEFISMIPEDIKSPDTTAKWWLIQEDIRNRKLGANELMKTVNADFKTIKESAYKGAKLSARVSAGETFGVCPVCGKPVKKAKSKKSGQIVYYCSGFKDGCKFSLWEKSKRFEDVIKITDKRAQTLLKGETITVELTKKDGGKYKAKVKLNVVKKDDRVFNQFEVVSYVKTKKKQ